MLQPARRKYRKEQKGRNKGVATRGAKVSFGEYGLSEARTTYGTIGVQVLVFKGETLGKGETPVAPAPEPEKKPARKPGVRHAAAS